MAIVPRGRREWRVFAAVCLFVGLFYSILLPAAYTQEISFANLEYLTPTLLAFAAAFAFLIGWIMTVQVRSMRLTKRVAGSKLTVLGALGALIPNLFCCTPVVPTLLALSGFSTAGIFATGGRIQGFFAMHEIDFLVGSLLLLLVSAVWTSHSTAQAWCSVAETKGR